MSEDGDGAAIRYVPAVAAEWDLDAPGDLHQELDATMCFVDISGFTNLSEKLAARGRIGAEELTEVLRRVFGSMISLAHQRGGNLVKFGGDALLLLFRGDGHVVQACSAAVEMRAALRESARIATSVGRVPLKMSVGLHTGTMHAYLVGDSHRELIITGPGATGTIEMEGTADAGEIVVSRAVRDGLPRGAATVAKADGWLLKWRKAPVAPVGPRPRRDVPLEAVVRCIPVGLRGHLETGEVEPEHRVGVVAFVKYKGVDELHHRLGSGAVAAALDEVTRVVQHAAERQGICFLASDIDADGGKFILTAGVPIAVEEDERRMLRALRAVVDAPTTLPIKIGVNRGHVFAGEIGASFRSAYTVMGDTVNLAARLMAAAPAGELYATPAVLDRSATVFESVELEPFAVKGKSAKVHAYSVGGEVGDRQDPSTEELPFVGRDAELAVLQTALGRLVSEGVGGVIELVGEVGTGKTRLVTEATAGISIPVVTIRGESYGSAMPYRAFREPVRQILGAGSVGPEAQQAALRDTVRTLAPHLEPLLPLVGRVAHVDMPSTPQSRAIEPRFLPDRTADVIVELASLVSGSSVVVVVEDTNWLDDTSAGLVERIAARAGDHHWLVIATRRSETSGVKLGPTVTIELAPLDEDAATALVNEATAASPLRPHDVARLVEQSGGNPLHLDGLVHARRDADGADLPESLEALIGTQIDSLRPLPHRILRYASVLGTSMRLSSLNALLAEDALHIDQATRDDLARFLEPEEPNRIRFRQAVVRDAAYERLSFARRRQLHARAAAITREAGGDDLDGMVDLLSLHHFRAQQYVEAWTYARRAGDRARATAANLAAAIHYERALAAARRLGTIGPDELGEVWTHLGDVRVASARFDEALDAYGRAAHLAVGPEMVAGAILKRARAYERAGRFSVALRDTAKVVRVLDDVDSVEADRLAARALAFRSGIRCAQERPADSLRLAEAAVAAARAAGEREGLAQALLIVDGMTRTLGRPAGEQNALEALAIYEELDDLTGQSKVHNNLAFELYYVGDWDRALDHLEQARSAATRTGDTVQSALATAFVGEIRVCQGRIEDAVEPLTVAARTLRASGFVDGATYAEINLARARLALSDIGGAIGLLDQVLLDVADMGLDASALEAAIYRAECDLVAGDPAAALARLTEAKQAAGEETAMFEVTLARLEGLALAAAGSAELGLERIDEGIATARRQELVYELAMLLSARTAVGVDDPGAQQEAGGLLSRLGARPPASLEVSG